MKRLVYLSFLAVFLVTACTHSSKDAEEEQAPFLLTNHIVFDDQTYTDFGAGFLVRHDQDTFAITSKQLFIAFSQFGLFTIDFKGKLQSWEMYPMDHPESKIRLGKLLNTDSTELSALPNATNNKDWLVFEVSGVPESIQVLEIAGKSPEKGTPVFSAYCKPGSGKEARQVQSLTGRIAQQFDNQAFLSMDQAVENPLWLTGAPLLNDKGEVIGLMTTQNQQIGQSCSATYFYDVIQSLK